MVHAVSMYGLTFDEDEDHESFWCSSKAPDQIVRSIKDTALQGLRRSTEVVSSLDNKMLPKFEGIPSIRRGRTVQQTIRAMSSTSVFTPQMLKGDEDDAMRMMNTRMVRV